MKLINKDALVAEIERIKKEECPTDTYEGRCKLFWFEQFLSFINAIEVKEVNEELAETYAQVFEKKFPILPTLKGKQLDKFKNFLNRCRQIFGLQEFGIHPVQAKLFEKLALLWAAWGAENLQGIGQVEGEADIVKEVDLEEEVTNQIRLLSGVHSFHDGKKWWKGTYNELSYFAKHFFELGLKAQKGE